MSENKNKDLNAIIGDLSDSISHAIKGVLEKASAKDNNDEDLSGTDSEKVIRAKEVQEKIERWTDLFKNNGYHNQFTRISLEDMLRKSQELAVKYANDVVTSQWYRNMIPSVVSNVIREPITLGNPITQLLTPVRFKNGTSIKFPAINAAGHIDCDMGEGEEYPELDLDMNGSVTATIGKCGIGLNFTEESIRYSAFDVIGLHARQAVDVLRRHKEKKAAAQIFSIGTVYINNDSGSALHSKGRGQDGNYNNTLIVDDIVDASLNAFQEGWRLDTMIVNPLAWQIFAKDPILREQFFRGLAGGSFVQIPNGSPANFPQLGVNTPYGKNVGPSTAVGLSNPSASSLSFTVPGYGGFGFNVILSNYAPIRFDPSLGLYITDIAMIQADQAGLLVIDEELTTEDWKDIPRDGLRMKFRERYSIVNVNQGKAGRILKGIRVAPAYFIEDKITWTLGTGPLPSTSITNP